MVLPYFFTPILYLRNGNYVKDTTICDLGFPTYKFPISFDANLERREGLETLYPTYNSMIIFSLFQDF